MQKSRVNAIVNLSRLRRFETRVRANLRIRCIIVTVVLADECVVTYILRNGPIYFLR